MANGTTPENRPTFGDKLRGLFSSLGERKQREAEKTLSTYAVLVDELASIEITGQGKLPSPEKVDQLLKESGKSEADLARDIATKREIHELKEAARAESNLVERRDELTAELDDVTNAFAKVQAAYHARTAEMRTQLEVVRGSLTHALQAKAKLAERLAGESEEQNRQERIKLLREIAELRGRSVLAPLPDASRVKPFESLECVQKLAKIDAEIATIRAQGVDCSGTTALDFRLRKLYSDRTEPAAEVEKQRGWYAKVDQLRALESRLAGLTNESESLKQSRLQEVLAK